MTTASSSAHERTTQERILDAAERLFARDGFDGTSVRAITSKAGVNLAAAHYHFGSKEALIRAVFARRLVPLEEDRLKRLDAVMEAAGDGQPDLEGVIRAFIEPAFKICLKPEQGGRRFTRLMGRVHAESGEQVKSVVNQLFSQTIQRFAGALQRALPQLSRPQIFWKMSFLVGSMAFVMASPDAIARGSQGACNPLDPREVMSQMVPFLTQGLRAPVPPLAPKEAS
ncbi:MAG TPA: TetR family transcriptional regulator [Acidobacteriota bacterium]|nr:TetR family transcriptional regulator [Acidobacteriota bacterium]